MFTETDSIFLALNVTSIVLAGIVTIFFVRFYKYFHSIPLENIVLGFGILVVSHSFGAAYQMMKLLSTMHQASLLLLIYISLNALAFSLISAGYILWRQEKKASRMRVLLTALLIFAIIILTLSAIMLSSDALDGFAAKMEYFHGVVFVLLLFVSWKSFKNYTERPDVRSSMVPAAFTLLAISQYSMFIWSVDGGLTSLVLGAICRILGLVLFLRVVLVQRRATING